MMKAVIANGPKDYQLIYDKPIPTLNDGEVLVKVLATGICTFILCYNRAHFDIRMIVMKVQERITKCMTDPCRKILEILLTFSPPRISKSSQFRFLF